MFPFAVVGSPGAQNGLSLPITSSNAYMIPLIAQQIVWYLLLYGCGFLGKNTQPGHVHWLNQMDMLLLRGQGCPRGSGLDMRRQDEELDSHHRQSDPKNPCSSTSLLRRTQKISRCSKKSPDSVCGYHWDRTTDLISLRVSLYLLM